MLQRLQDKLCYVRLPGMYQHATSSITFKVSSSAYCCCWSALPRSVLVTIVSTIFSILHCSNPEQHKIAQKTSEIPRRTAPLQNHSDLSKKVKSSITIMLVRERQAMPFATLTFLCNTFNPWFLCWSAFHHMLIAVRLSFILNISSRNSFGTTGMQKYFREGVHTDCELCGLPVGKPCLSPLLKIIVGPANQLCRRTSRNNQVPPWPNLEISTLILLILLVNPPPDFHYTILHGVSSTLFFQGVLLKNFLVPPSGPKGSSLPHIFGKLICEE